MGARRSWRPSDLGSYDEEADISGQAAPQSQRTDGTTTPRRPLQLEEQPVKPAQGGGGGKDRAGRRRPSKQTLLPGGNSADGDRHIVVIGEKATTLPRVEAGAARDPVRRESADSVVEEESSAQAEKDRELSGLAELVQAEIERAAKVQVVEHLKQRTAQALKEVAVLRDKLERTEAAVVGGKKKRDNDVEEREDQLRRSREEIRRLESEGEYFRAQLAKSVADGARLGEELKRTQESLLFLSAWDEEKIELESEVADLKAQLSAVSIEGTRRLDLAHREFNIITATTGQKTRLRLERDTAKIRLDLERGLSEEFKSLKRENEVLRREAAHKDSEINRIMKNAALIESDNRAARAELGDERRMHHTTIRNKKRAEAIITELQAQLSMALSSAAGRPYSPSNINLSPRRPRRQQWGGAPRPPAPMRAKMVVRGGNDKGGGGRYREVLPESGQESLRSKVSTMYLVPPRKGGEDEADDDRKSAGGGSGAGVGVGAGAGGASGAGVAVLSTGRVAASTTSARRDPDEIPPEKGRDDEARPTNKHKGRLSVGPEGHGGDDDIPELLPCGSGSEITTGDVWGVLDSYVHRRSEVARANRHLGAIEAMRRHLEKNNTPARKPAGGNCSSTTVTVQYDNRGRRVRKGGEGHERDSDEAVWRASRRKRTRQDDRISDASALERRAPSDWRRPAQSKKAAGTKQAKPRERVQPRPPPPRSKRDDASVSSMSQITAVRFWKECDQESTPGKKPSPREKSRASRQGATRGGGAEKENAGHGRGGGGGGGTMVMISDGRPGNRPRGIGDSGQRCPKRGGSLTCPSKGGGDDDPPSCVSIDSSSLHQNNSEEEASASAATRVVGRAPSPASSLASGVGVTAVAGRLWGNNATGGAPPSEQQGGGGKGLGLEAKGFRKKGGKVGSWGRRTSRLETELADWLETNTNLVNVSPW
eukprot:g5554.t1